MTDHEFANLRDFIGKSLPYFTTHHDLVDRQKAARDAKEAARVAVPAATPRPGRATSRRRPRRWSPTDAGDLTAVQPRKPPNPHATDEERRMTRNVISGLIQASNPINDESRSVAEIQAAMLEKHLPMIHDAGKQGVQILCLQEIFNGPYFCPSQDKRWYDAAEPVPGPTRREARADREEVPDGDGRPALRARAGRRLLQHRRDPRRRRQLPRQVPQEPHPADRRVLGEVLLPAGQPGLSGVQDPVRDDRRVHLLRPPLPRGRARARPGRRRDRLQPVGHGRRAVAVPVEARAAGARGRQRLLRRRDQPGRHRGAVEHRQVLRQLVLRAIRAARSSRAPARTRTSCWSPRSIST